MDFQSFDDALWKDDRYLMSKVGVLKRELAGQRVGDGRKQARQLDVVAEHLLSLFNQVAAQALLTQTMLNYMRKQPGWDQQNFENLFHELDASDGKVDGKLDGAEEVDLTVKRTKNPILPKSRPRPNLDE